MSSKKFWKSFLEYLSGTKDRGDVLETISQADLQKSPRQLDIYVSRYIFKKEVEVNAFKQTKIYKIKGELELLPDYSDRIDHALKVVDAFGHWVITISGKKYYIRCNWRGHWYSLYSDTLEGGICRVALMAKLSKKKRGGAKDDKKT